MTKYEPLHDHLNACDKDVLPMTFKSIEKVIGAKLPPSAFKHRPWWSNSDIAHSHPRSWLSAGYETANVDMLGCQLVFRKKRQSAPPVGKVRPALGRFAHIYGAFKGMVAVASDTDLTAPAGEEWDAER